MKILATALLFLVCASKVFAGPMGFKESFMSMGDFSPNWQEAFVNYAMTPRDAIGIEGLAMRSDDQRLNRQTIGLTYTRLVQRWNMPEAQANIWFVGGLSEVKGNNFSGTRTMFSPGLQVDYETTRVYLAASGRLYRASGLRHDYASMRAGFSFYEVNYEETQPWLLLEVRRMRDLSEKTEITPMLRLIHKRYFIEAGFSNMKQARFNFMYIF
jgi:hypothetical protein